MSYDSNFAFFGNYKNGQAVGDFWVGMKGGGYLQGKLGCDVIKVAREQIGIKYVCSNPVCGSLMPLLGVQMIDMVESTSELNT